jgi:hypothetical protein
MHGSCLCLLAISVLAPVMLNSQSDRPAHDFVRPLPPRWLQPPTAVPFQPPWPTPPETTGFPQIARAAGTIFSGTVTAVARRSATGGQAVETVAITFHVENAIRGAIPGETLTISQWIGLWLGGQRYHIGERVFLFLYPPSKLGLTSTVGGGMGRFIVDPRGRVLLSGQHFSAFRQDPVLGGKTHARFSDFALAVRRTRENENEEE